MRIFVINVELINSLRFFFSKREAFFNRENYQFESESTPGEDWWIQSAANNAVR